jgi:DNA-binding transcriptional MerR regulator
VTSYLSIGDFSRATHMTVKTLRHYHEIRLLEPADVDPHTGYRRYAAEQIPTAQVVRRFRDLGMPLEEIRTVLATSDVAVRNRHIGAHLGRLEQELDRTRRAVAALHDQLSPPASAGAPAIGLRTVPAVPAAAVTATVEARDVGTWFQGALGELFATLAGQGLRATGPAGGVYADELFTEHRGRATVFVPCAGPVRPLGRVEPLEVPPGEFAVIEHTGPPSEVDRAYGALAGYVARHALAVDGPLREYYLVGQRQTADSARWRTEVCWPVFRTGVPDGGAGPAR